MKSIFKQSVEDLTKRVEHLKKREKKLGSNSNRRWLISQIEEAIMVKGQDAVGFNNSMPANRFREGRLPPDGTLRSAAGPITFAGAGRRW